MTFKTTMLKKISLLILLVFGLTSTIQAQKKTKVFKLESYGVLPDQRENSAPLLEAALKKIKSEMVTADSVVIQFKKGRYDFHTDGAVRREYYISNHDQDNPKIVGIELEGFKNITIDGNGSDLIFHGRMLPLALIENNNVKIKNLSIDFEKPHIAQVKVVKNDTIAGSIIFETAPWVTYTIKDSIFYNAGEGWEMQPIAGIAFEEQTKRIVYNSGDIAVGTTGVSELSPGLIKAHHWKNSKLIPGTVVAMRSYHRPTPGIFIHKGENINFENVKVHYAEGMGLLAQLTENISLDGFEVALRGKDDPRYFTTQADATHFSSCKGVITSTDGLYEGMMDDAINIHGTYLKLLKKVDAHTVIAKYMHHQAYGFDWGYAGDSVQFIKSKTMDLWDHKNTIVSITPVRTTKNEPIKEFRIEFAEDLGNEIDPANFDIGIENLTWTPSVIFTGNTIRNNRARGALFSTPKPTLIANNLFDHTSGCAILLCGDSNGWYETGASTDVTIRDNKFVNALTSMYQFTSAIISIYPEIPDLGNQTSYFHSGIRIENNEFETFDHPILYAKSVNGLIFKNNTVITNQEYPPFHSNTNAILFERVLNAEVTDNTLNGKTIDLLNRE
ncbi:right-handed parallel beta-helix repeat-containing protein [Gelidibacter salicanalis]|uniref:Alpha-1,3-galactosidase B n=1 Tax=Gelidibacter salicanalis TaxID=291193 RepID=A0A934NI40_9FLAO|nr:alpha-1,3-galactosidase B [Gelidibacter salicanalis]MBJ7880603.1 alpha-1,3-galactosidase B [Gelidibacter salicanalis]